MVPDLSSLHTSASPVLSRAAHGIGIPIPEDIEDTRGDRYMEKLKEYAKSIPYAIEPYSKAVELLDFFILRLMQSVEAKDFDVGFQQWDMMLT